MTQPSGTPVLREEWLTLAAEALRTEMIKKGKVALPFVRLSVGFPLGARPRPGANGSFKPSQCWPPTTTTDGMPQIYISPLITTSEEVLVALLHEMLHITSGDSGHARSGKFHEMCKAFGLKGWPTKQKPEPWLAGLFTGIVTALGMYEDIHASPIIPQPTPGGGKNTFMKKVFCRCCGDLSRRAQSHITKLKEAIALGAPSCQKCSVGHPDCTGLCKQPPPPSGGGGGSPPPPTGDFDATPQPPPPPSQGQGQQGEGGGGDAGNEGAGEGEKDKPDDSDGGEGMGDEGEGGGDSANGGQGAGAGDGADAGTAPAQVVIAKAQGGVFTPTVHRKDLCPFKSGCPQCENDY